MRSAYIGQIYVNDSDLFDKLEPEILAKWNLKTHLYSTFFVFLCPFRPNSNSKLAKTAKGIG